VPPQQQPHAQPTPTRPVAVAPSGHVYVVQEGDSLWSIAARLLGPGATSGRLAREVNRLWDMNADRIRSGRPELIQPGEHLRLP
jgi:nucleoid-associated protein YgaU